MQKYKDYNFKKEVGIVDGKLVMLLHERGFLHRKLKPALNKEDAKTLAHEILKLVD